MERYLCIHAHFYQPPRENPWLEAIELQDSASPYHDWNERISAECYGPNATSRILDGEGRILRIVNNYSKISFNFGPTILSWMEEKAPGIYRAILEADEESRRRFSGHGSAMAQAYNHMILPLANERDIRTQVLWGIRDFEHRFRRRPEGLWLPETAVDLRTLEALAAAGITFTVLEPHQAARVRKMGDHNWKEVGEGKIDPSRAYQIVLPSGRKLALFFYDGPISRAVAFENLLARGEIFAERLVGAFSDSRTWPQLMHIATDGETYGHHHRFGDMALAYALEQVESNHFARLTDYGEFLERHPPEMEVEIAERTSWSCVHGVERWQGDCGCNTGGHEDWNQAWRGPLRESLDGLRDGLVPKFEEQGRRFFRDPWEARDDYINVILGRSPESLEAFWGRQASKALSPEEKVIALKLMEIQRHAQLMYTSCGWFFDELSRIETIQVLQYAARALQLAREVLGDDLEGQFLNRLQAARSNLPEIGDGRQVFERFVRPSMVGLAQVAAHYGVSSLFEGYGESTQVHCYTVNREDYREFNAGSARLVVGRVRVVSRITQESDLFSLAVLHMGDHNLSGGVRRFLGDEAYQNLEKELTEVFGRADVPGVIRLLDSQFQAATYSLRSLFRDEQRKILALILASRLKEVEGHYRQIYEGQAPLMQFLESLGYPLPESIAAAAEFALGGRLRDALSGPKLDTARIRACLEELKLRKIKIDGEGLEFVFRRNVEQKAACLVQDPKSMAVLKDLEEAVSLSNSLPFTLNLWEIQNTYYRLMKEVYGENKDPNWRSLFQRLGELLYVHLSDKPSCQNNLVIAVAPPA